MKNPSRSGRRPPVTSRAPSASAAAIRPCTFSRWPSKATGPISVSASSGSPSRTVAARAATRSSSSSCTARSTSSREPAMHVCPVAANTPATTPLAAASRSASANTTCGDLPPSSRLTRARCPAAARMTAVPVAVEPVKATLSTPGCSASGAPASGPKPGEHVEDAGREAGLLEEPRELERRGRRLLGRLGDDGAARGQRGRELPRQQQHRRVPRRDRGDHADRLAARVDQPVLARAGDRLAADLVGGARPVVQVVRQPAQLLLHLAQQLAVVGHLDRGDLERALGDEVGERGAAAARARGRASAATARRRTRARAAATAASTSSGPARGTVAHGRAVNGSTVSNVSPERRVDPLAAHQHPVGAGSALHG